MDRGMGTGQDGDPSGAAPLRDASRRDPAALPPALEEMGALERLMDIWYHIANIPPVLRNQATEEARHKVEGHIGDIKRRPMARSAPEAASAEGSPSHPSGPSQDSQEVREALKPFFEAWDWVTRNRDKRFFPTAESSELVKWKDLCRAAEVYRALLSQSPKGAAGAASGGDGPSAPKTGLRGAPRQGNDPWPSVDASWLVSRCQDALRDAREGGAVQWRQGLEIILSQANASIASGRAPGDVGEAGGGKA